MFLARSEINALGEAGSVAFIERKILEE